VPHWQLAFDQLSWSKPQIYSPDGTVNLEEIFSYYEYLKEHYPASDDPKGEQNKLIF